METTNLTNHFLIAMPQLEDPNFHQTTTYICEHNKDGAMGLIINRPLELNLDDMLKQINIDSIDDSLESVTVHYGGPVQKDRGFILHQPATLWESTVVIADNLAITTSKDILTSIANGHSPKNYLITLGYAGWDAGQLEEELANNAWLNGPADASIIFNEPVENRWRKAASAMGVDLNMLSSDTGHA